MDVYLKPANISGSQEGEWGKPRSPSLNLDRKRSPQSIPWTQDDV